MSKKLPPTAKSFADAKQRLMDELLNKHSEQPLSGAELQQLEQLVQEAEALMVENATTMAEYALNEPNPDSTGAVPVTVWVNSEGTANSAAEK